MSQPPTLSIVIGTRNRLSQLKLCLQAIMGRVRTPYEIVAVDAGSTDGTPQYLSGTPGLQVVLDGTPIGQARSLNRVFKTLSSQYVCWLSDDNVALPGALDSAVSILDSSASIGLVALKTKDVIGPHTQAPYIGGIWPSGVLNCNQAIIRRELFQAVGHFDEAFRDYGIDADLTTQVLLAGYQVVYTKQVSVHHYRKYSEAQSAIPNDQRSLRQSEALALYRKKYSSLLWSGYVERQASRVRSVLWKRLDAYLSRATGALAGENTLLGYNRRDWYNVFHSRHISLLDFWLNRHQPYYLTQSMPTAVVRRQVNEKALATDTNMPSTA